MSVIKKLIIAVIITAPIIGAVCYVIFAQPPYLQNLKDSIEYHLNIPDKDVKILFTGDLMFDRGIRYFARINGGNDFIFDKIHSFLQSNDIVISNLEGSITDNVSVSAGTTPGSTNNYFFTFDPSVAQTLYKQNIKIVDLGNNHILNFGRDGLKETKDYLDSAKVNYFGAPDYSKSVSTKIKGIKITFISYNEFSDLPEDTEEEITLKEIEKVKEYSDIIIVFCHWGVEYSLEPNAGQKDLAHQFINKGADLVIGSHPHVVQPSENYNGKTIYYSLGNFIFDQYFSEDVRRGLGVQLEINSQTKILAFKEYNFYLQGNGQTVVELPE